ncbi:MAG TPA: protein kinase [Kofleriaceae bacterium]|nr:protein kinase [Kofleriaceae bacterium]
MTHASASGDPERTIDGEGPRAEPIERVPVEAGAAPALDYPELSVVERRHYAIAREIAKGGMGRVLEARDLRLGRPVAIKELLPKNRDVTRRFEREARITARLQHPAIIHVYEAGVWPGGEPFYAMPLVPGRSLDKVVAERATLVERLGLVPTVLAVADALAYAHSERVIHRDLKPANVLVGEFGQTVVIDWGLAKDLGAAPADPKDSMSARLRASSDETLSGGVVGTPAYMPPEQARGEPVDQRADVYAIGALLYKVLAGHAPYAGASSARVLEAVKAAPPIPLDEREPGTPPDLAAIVAKAMAREPRDRYDNAGELAKDLARFQTGQLVAAHRYTTRQLAWRFVRRYRLPLAVGAIALAALAVVGGLSVRRVLDEKARAETKRLALLEERGRSELLAERAGPALVYLVHASADAEPGAARAFLLAEAMRPFQAERHVLAAGSGEVALAVSADGKLAATGSDRVALWDVETGGARFTETGFSRVRALAFDPAGTHLAAGGDDGHAWIWDVAHNGRPLELRHGGPITDVAFSADGRRLVTASADTTAVVWDVATGARVATSRCHAEPVLSARLSPDGTRLATASADGTACVWSVDNDALISPLRGHKGAVRRVRWSPDGKRVLTASDDGTAREFDPDRGTPLANPFQHRKAVVTAELSPDGDRVLTASADHDAIVWELPDGEDANLPTPVAKVELAATDELVAAVFDASGDRVATAALDGVAKVWDATNGQAIASFEHAGSVRAIAFAGESRLVTADLAGHAHVWDLGRGLAGEPHDLESVVHAVAAAGDWVAAGTDGSAVALWHAGHALDPLREHRGRVLAVALDGTTLVTGGEDPQAIVWDLASDHPAIRCRLAANNDEQTRALAASDGIIVRVLPDAVEVWTSDCHRLATRADQAAGLAAAAVRQDGHELATGGEDGVIVVLRALTAGAGGWLLADARPVRALAGAISALAYSPDGRRLLVGGNGVAKIVEVATGHELETLDGPFGTVTAVAWLDDERVVTANTEGLARVWDAQKGKLLGVRGARGAAIDAIAVAGDVLWLGGHDGTVRGWNVGVSREPAAQRAALAASTGWILGDDDVVRRKAED